MIDPAIIPQATPVPAAQDPGPPPDPGYYWSDPGWKNPYVPPFASHQASAPPAYFFRDPAGVVRPGTAPGSDAQTAYAAAILRRLMLFQQSQPTFVPQPRPVWVPGSMSVNAGPGPAPDPGLAMIHADPLFQAMQAALHQREAAPAPSIRRARSTEDPRKRIGAETLLRPGVPTEYPLQGIGAATLRRGPRVQLRRGGRYRPGDEVLNPGVGG